MTQKINDDVHITGKVGIDIENPAEKLEVDGKVKATEFVGKGSEITDLNGENISTGIIDDARIQTTIARVEHKHSGGTGDGPRVSHKNLDDILQVDPSSNDNDLTKHVSDELAKGWQDHLTNTENPHKTTAAQLSDYLSKQFQANIKFTNSDNNGATRTVNVGFKPKFVQIIGGFSVVKSNGRPIPIFEPKRYGSSLSGFWSPKLSGGTTIILIVSTSKDIRISCSSSPSIFSIYATFLNKSGAPTENEKISGSISFSSEGVMTVKIIRSGPKLFDNFDISLSMFCIG